MNQTLFLPTTTLPTNSLATPGPVLEDLLERAQDYADASLAANTKKAYACDWVHFRAWCEARGLCPLPATVATLIAYLTDQADAGSKVSTLRRRTVSIRYHHQAMFTDHDPTRSEEVVTVMKGISRQLGTAMRKAPPIMSEVLKAMLATLDLEKLQSQRDRALITLGFSAALRRSELVALCVEDLTWRKQGVTVLIRRSKTDQEGLGEAIPLHRGRTEFCPVNALKNWCELAQITSGPIFRAINKGGALAEKAMTDRSVALIVKRLAAAAEVPDPGEFSAHSLRSGMITTAIVNGCSAFEVMEVSRHKSEAVFRGYVQRAKVAAYSNQTTTRLGL